MIKILLYNLIFLWRHCTHSYWTRPPYYFLKKLLWERKSILWTFRGNTEKMNYENGTIHYENSGERREIFIMKTEIYTTKILGKDGKFIMKTERHITKILGKDGKNSLWKRKSTLWKFRELRNISVNWAASTFSVFSRKFF